MSGEDSALHLGEGRTECNTWGRGGLSAASRGMGDSVQYPGDGRTQRSTSERTERSTQGTERSTRERTERITRHPGPANQALVPGLIGAAVAAIAGAASSFIAYQKKKLCFQERGEGWGLRVGGASWIPRGVCHIPGEAGLPVFRPPSPPVSIFTLLWMGLPVFLTLCCQSFLIGGGASCFFSPSPHIVNLLPSCGREFLFPSPPRPPINTLHEAGLLSCLPPKPCPAI